MSNKFTGITSAGSAIPVYDKDAHSALSQKLDTSAFSSVSGEFATVDDIVAAVSGKADTSAIPSLDGYATQEWVGEQGYLTEVPESAVSGFATHEEVESATSGKMNVSGLASGQTAADVWNRQTVYSAYNGIPFYAGDKLDKSAASAVSPNFNQNNSQNDGYAKFSGWNRNVGIDISGAHTNKRIYITDEGITLSGYSSNADASMHWNAHYLNITPETYVDKTTFKNIVTGNNETFVPNDVKTASGNYDTQYSNYSFIGDFSGNDNLGREFTVTLPVATTSVTYTAAQQNWDWFYIGTLTAEEPKTVWKITPNKDYTAKQDSTVSTGTFYTFQITQSPFPWTGGVVSASILTWNDEVFATRPWVEEQLSANVPQGVMQTSGLEYDGDKISGYMGSAFKAGDELPSGVMVESAVGYNAVNEISGYNGSAIAQYGAEKQWLVHDDTLVHAANSAQYALGVNLSAVAQLLGVDETVLWSGELSVGQTAALTENYSAFRKLEFKYRPWSTADNAQMKYEQFGTEYRNWQTLAGWMKNNLKAVFIGDYSATDANHITLTSACFNNIIATNAWADASNNYRLFEIRGIGRKS